MKEFIIEMENYANEHNVPIIEKDSIAFTMKYIKSPNIKSHGSMRNRNENNYKNAKNVLDTLRKGSSTKNEIFSLNSDFLHCRNCMLIVALSKYGKYSFNK